MKGNLNLWSNLVLVGVILATLGVALIVDISHPAGPAEDGFFMIGQGREGEVSAGDYVLWIISFTAVIAALLVHQVAWYTRLHYLTVAVVLGSVAVLVLVLVTGFFVPFLLDRHTGADATYVLQYLFTILWVFVLLFAFLVGTLQAWSLPVPWWKGVLSACFEAGLAFLALVGVNYAMHYFVFTREIPYRVLGDAEYLNRFISGFMVVWVILSVLRPVVRLYGLKRTQ